jgi:hypothetical protein
MKTSLRRIRICAAVIGSILAASGIRGIRAESNLSALTLPSEIAKRIAECWHAPQTEPPQIIEVTVRLSFTQFGAIFGEPRVTYISAPEISGLKEEVRKSALDAVKACTPLPFTPSLGAAIAGRIFSIRLRSAPSSGKRRLI